MINVTTKYYSGFNISMAFYMYNLQTETQSSRSAINALGLICLQTIIFYMKTIS